jgi:hypothetical protein
LVKQPADSAPARFGTEDDWSYNRKTGLKGNATDNYIDSGRNNNADPTFSKHIGVYRTESETRDTQRTAIGNGAGAPGDSQLISEISVRRNRVNNAPTDPSFIDSTSTPGYWGASRGTTSKYQFRYAGTTYDVSSVGASPSNGSIYVYKRNTAGYSNARLAFYSIGESLDLAALDTRVSALITAIGAAIP